MKFLVLSILVATLAVSVLSQSAKPPRNTDRVIDDLRAQSKKSFNEAHRKASEATKQIRGKINHKARQRSHELDQQSNVCKEYVEAMIVSLIDTILTEDSAQIKAGANTTLTNMQTVFAISIGQYQNVALTAVTSPTESKAIQSIVSDLASQLTQILTPLFDLMGNLGN